MKIISLSGSNMASLAQTFSLNFDEEPLLHAGLIMIGGKTGSGKSTLLDTLCVALFDNYPRLLAMPRQIAMPQSYKDADGIRSGHDARLIVRRGADNAWARVSFRGKDGDLYEALWSVRRAGRSGQLLPAEMSLRNMRTAEVLGGKKTETLLAIKEALGLSYDQFCRSVLLAQGEFAAFLRSSPQIRAQLLEKLTGTDLYAKISTWTYYRRQKEFERYKNLSLEYEKIESLSDDEVLAVDLHLKEVDIAINNGRKFINNLYKFVEWFEEYDKKKIINDEVYSNLKKSLEKYSLFDAKKKYIEKSDRLGEDFFHDLKDLYRIKGDLSRNKDDLNGIKELKEKNSVYISHLKSEIIEFEMKKSKRTDYFSSIEREIDDAIKLDVKIEEINFFIKRSSDELIILNDKYNDINSRLMVNDSDIRLEDESLSRVMERLSLFSELYDYISKNDESFYLEIKEDIDSYIKMVKYISLYDKSSPTYFYDIYRQSLVYINYCYECISVSNELERTQDYLSNNTEQPVKKKDLDESIYYVDDLKSRLDSIYNIFCNIGNKGDELEDISFKMNKNEENMDKYLLLREIESKKHEEMINRRKNFEKKEKLASLISELHNGKACPLCGSLEHPAKYDHKNNVNNEQDDYDILIDQMAKKIENLNHKIHYISGEEGSLKKHKELLSKVHSRDITKKIQEEDSLKKYLIESQQSFRFLDPPSLILNSKDDFNQWFNFIEMTRSQIKILVDKLTDYENRQRNSLNAIQSLNNKRIKCYEDRDRITDNIHHLNQNINKRENEYYIFREKYNRFKVKIVKYLGIDGLDKINNREFYEKIINWLSYVPKLINEKDSILQNKEMLVNKNKEYLAEKDYYEKNIKDKEDINNESRLRLGKVKGERFNCLNNESVDRTRKNVEVDKDNLEKEYKILMDKLKDYEHKDMLVINKEKLIINFMQNDELNANKISSKINNKCKESNVSFRDARYIAMNDLSSWREDYLKVKDDLNRASSLYENRKKDLDDWGLSKPYFSYEQLQNCQTWWSSEIDSLLRKKFMLESIISQNLKHREEHIKIHEHLIDQEKHYTLWNQLSHLIGSADGHKFRNYAQHISLLMLIDATNEQLRAFIPRYSLMAASHMTMDLFVVDHDMADELRPISGLSGGESFLMSLALALGLSSLSSGKTVVESLFIDEGFGTLDPDALDLVMTSLEGLYSQGRQVSIVSHLSSLASRVHSRIFVESIGSGLSRVHVKGFI